MDKIILNQIPGLAIIGTLPQERVRRQEIFCDIIIELDLHAAAQSDNLFDTVDYSEIEFRAKEIMENSSFLLLEALCGALGEMVMSYQLINRCQIHLTKPHAAKFGKSVEVELEFSR